MFLFVLLVFCLGAFVGWKFIPQNFPPQKFERVDNKVYITYMYREYAADVSANGTLGYTSDVKSLDPAHDPSFWRQNKIKNMWNSMVAREERDKHIASKVKF